MDQHSDKVKSVETELRTQLSSKSKEANALRLRLQKRCVCVCVCAVWCTSASVDSERDRCVNGNECHYYN